MPILWGLFGEWDVRGWVQDHDLILRDPPWVGWWCPWTPATAVDLVGHSWEIQRMSASGGEDPSHYLSLGY